MDWDAYHISIAMTVAMKSKDPSTKVGCVLVGSSNNILSTGFNGFARGIDENDPKRWERPKKYDYVVHAEHNAIFNAARHGVALEGATAYLNWEPCPCERCASALVQSGIIRVVGPAIPFPGVGNGAGYDTHLGLAILAEAGVEVSIRSGLT